MLHLLHVLQSYFVRESGPDLGPSQEGSWFVRDERRVKMLERDVYGTKEKGGVSQGVCNNFALDGHHITSGWSGSLSELGLIVTFMTVIRHQATSLKCSLECLNVHCCGALKFIRR